MGETAVNSERAENQTQSGHSQRPFTGSHIVSSQAARPFPDCLRRKVDARPDLGQRLTQRVDLLAMLFFPQPGPDRAARLHWEVRDRVSKRPDFTEGRRSGHFSPASGQFLSLTQKLDRQSIEFVGVLPLRPMAAF